MLLAALLVLQTPPPLEAPPSGSPATTEVTPPAEPSTTPSPAPAPATAPPAAPASDGPAEPPPSAANPADTAPKPAPPPAARAPAVGVGATVFDAKEKETELARSRYTLGKGWTLSSADERFSLQVRARLQLRYDLEHYNVPDKDVAHSLQVRRMRLSLQGNVFSKYVRYHFQFGFAPRDMQNDLPNEPGSIRRNPLRDARAEFSRLRDFNVWIGQFKTPFSRQRMLSSSNMNLVDRSSVSAEFNLDRNVGVEAFSKDVGGLGGYLAYYAGVFMGEGRNAFDLTDLGMLYVGRLEVLPFGKFEDNSEGDLARSKRPGLAIAGAYAFQDRAHAAKGVIGDYPADRGTTDFHHITADLLFKWRGLSLTTAFHVRRGFNRKNGGALDDMGAPIATVAARSGLGWFGQLGYVVPKIPLEVVGRYGLVRNNHGDRSSLKDADEAGGGINYYFVGHDLKLQLDYLRLWDASLGATPAEAARNGTDRLRLQVQVFF